MEGWESSEELCGGSCSAPAQLCRPFPSRPSPQASPLPRSAAPPSEGSAEKFRQPPAPARRALLEGKAVWWGGGGEPGGAGSRPPSGVWRLAQTLCFKIIIKKQRPHLSPRVLKSRAAPRRGGRAGGGGRGEGRRGALGGTGPTTPRRSAPLRAARLVVRSGGGREAARGGRGTAGSGRGGGAERGAAAAQAAEWPRTSNEGSGARLLLVSPNQLPLIAAGAESELMFKGAARRPRPKLGFPSPPPLFFFSSFPLFFPGEEGTL